MHEPINIVISPINRNVSVVATPPVQRQVTVVVDDKFTYATKQELAEAIAGVQAGSGSTYQFPIASTQWVVVHNRGYWPQVSVSDNLGENLLSDIRHVSVNETHIFHQYAQAGQVYIN